VGYTGASTTTIDFFIAERDKSRERLWELAFIYFALPLYPAGLGSLIISTKSRTFIFSTGRTSTAKEANSAYHG
jgi:hypothetical protein